MISNDILKRQEQTAHVCNKRKPNESKNKDPEYGKCKEHEQQYCRDYRGNRNTGSTDDRTGYKGLLASIELMFSTGSDPDCIKCTSRKTLNCKVYHNE